MTVWFFASFMAWILAWLGLAGYLFLEKLWPEETKIPFVVFAVVRLACSILDLPLWYLDLHEFVLKRWAASLSTSEKRSQPPRTHSPRPWAMGMNPISILIGACFPLLSAIFQWRWPVLCGICLLSEIGLRFTLAFPIRRLFVTPFIDPPAKWEVDERNKSRRVVSLANWAWS
jgi:hypothetical protein